MTKIVALSFRVTEKAEIAWVESVYVPSDDIIRVVQVSMSFADTTNKE